MDSRAPDVATLPAPSRDRSRLRADLLTHGYCIIERALDGAALAAVQRRLFEQAGAEQTRHALKNPANPQPLSQWVGMLLNKGAPFFDLVTHEIGTALIAELLGDDYLISCVDAQIQHPGSTAMPLHSDQWWMPAPTVPGTPAPRPGDIRRNTGTSQDPTASRAPISSVMAANVMWMATDFTVENGATRVVPGSHLSGCAPDPSAPHPVATVAATGPAGTAFAFDGRLWHSAGANTTHQSRYGITSTFCAPQCRQLENYTRGLRPEVMARCSPQILQRLGFRTWSSYGHTGDPDTLFTGDGDAAVGELRPG